MDVQFFTNLPDPSPWHFIPENFRFETWQDLLPYFTELVSRELVSKEDLVQWLADQNELNRMIMQAHKMAEIQVAMNTEDKEAEKKFLFLENEIMPACKLVWDRLNRKLLSSSWLGSLDRSYTLMIKQRTNRVEIFNEKNVALESQEKKFIYRHDQIRGRQTAHFQDREQTLTEISTYLEHPDRSLREQAYRVRAEARLGDVAGLDSLFDELVELRQQKAVNAGFANFRDYQFKKLARFDYTADDCLGFHDACRQFVVPALKQLARHRKNAMQLETLRPWDLAVDPRGLDPLKPFANIGELIRGCDRIFNRLDPELGCYFERLEHHHLLDLENRVAKAPGGFQATLPLQHLPFIFMNAVGQDHDVRTLLHESGHAFHTFLTAVQSIEDYKDIPMEFCEVASMSMELLADPYLDEFYSQAEHQRSRLGNLESILRVLAWIATIDAFQHWVYTHPTYTRDERRKYWLGLCEHFDDQTDRSGLEKFYAASWQNQLHLFHAPFYYIEYAIAQLGALGLWRRSKEDFHATLHDYKKALGLGGSLPLPELFATAGIPFDFGPKTLKPLVEFVLSEWQSLV